MTIVKNDGSLYYKIIKMEEEKKCSLHTGMSQVEQLFRNLLRLWYEFILCVQGFPKTSDE